VVQWEVVRFDQVKSVQLNGKVKGARKTVGIINFHIHYELLLSSVFGSIADALDTEEDVDKLKRKSRIASKHEMMVQRMYNNREEGNYWVSRVPQELH
jgi:hypothetical protein